MKNMSVFRFTAEASLSHPKFVYYGVDSGQNISTQTVISPQASKYCATRCKCEGSCPNGVSVSTYCNPGQTCYYGCNNNRDPYAYCVY